MKLGRRSLLLGLTAALGLDPLSHPGWLSGPARAGAAALGQAPPGSAPATLTPAELEDLLAFAELLVEGRSLPAPERGYLLDHLDARMQDPGGYYPELYRTTVGLLTRLAGARFSTLSPDQRLALLARHRLTPDAPPREPRAEIPADLREVRARAIPDLIGGYYRSSAGWAIAGASHFPGQCGELARYTSPEP